MTMGCESSGCLLSFLAAAHGKTVDACSITCCPLALKVIRVVSCIVLDVNAYQYAMTAKDGPTYFSRKQDMTTA